MTDAIQTPPPSVQAVHRPVPQRTHPIEPAKKPQTDNKSANDHGKGDDEARAAAAERRLSITHDQKLKTFVYRSIEGDTGEVVWQYPSEEILRRAQYLRDIEERSEHEVDEQA